MLAWGRPMPLAELVAKIEAVTVESARAAGRALIARGRPAIAALGPGVDAEGAVLDGDPVATLVDESADDDLLFTGSRGHGPFRRVVLGSVSTHLLRDAACPVVVVPRVSGETEPAPADPAAA